MYPNSLTHTASVQGVAAVYPSGEDATPTRRYRLNLVLLCSASILISLWFYLHLRTMVTEILFISGPLTVWGLWKLIEAIVLANVDRKDLTRKFLAHDNATQYLGFANAIAIMALLLTSSIYVVYGPTAEAKSVVLRVDEEWGEGDSKIRKTLFAPRTLNTSDKALGRLFWPARPRKVVVTVMDPPGKLPVEETLGWCPSAIYLELFDKRFKNAEYRILRIAPVSNFPIETEAESIYTLIVSRGDKELCTVANARLRTHYLGVPDPALSKLVPKDDARYREKVQQFLETADTGDTLATIRNALLKPPEIIGTEPLKQGDKLSIVVNRKGEPATEWKTTDVVIGSAPVQTCFMRIVENELLLDCE